MMFSLNASSIYRSSAAAASQLPRIATLKRAGTMFAIASVFALSACSDSNDAKEAQSDKLATTQEGKFIYPATDYAEQAKGIPGGTLKVSVATDALSLDLHSISHGNAQWLGRILYDNLVYLDDKGNISPWLAKSWDISPDGKTYTFHLRDDVTFSDDAKFNAEAVRVNLEHMRDPATKSPLAAAYIAPYIDGKIIDEYTFQANLREPYTPFLNVLAQSWLSMESPKAIKENPKQLGDHPVGSGPFVLESYTRQQGMRFVKRKDYHWAPPQVKHEGPAYLDRIEIEYVAEPIIRYNSLAAGQYDLTLDAPPQNAAAIRADSNLVFDSRVRTGIPFRGITFNTSKFPFDDVKVRKAIALAVDREGIVQIVGFGEYLPKTDFLAANTQYYDPSFRDVLKYDPAKANKLLDEAGWTTRDAAGYRTKDGKRLSAEVLVSATAVSTPTFAAIQSDVKKIGVELTIAQLPLTQVTERRNANDYQALGAGVWHTNTPDALYIVHHSNEITTEKRVGQNTARLRDAELDDALAKARQSSDPAVLQQQYSIAQKRLTELVPGIPLYENYTSIAYQRRVKGLVFDTSHNTVYFPSVWLQKDPP
jgi:peptide/nickel transport system substrate-binding protein